MAIRCLGLVSPCFTPENRACDEEMIEFFKDDLVFPFAAGAELELWHSHFVGKDLHDTPQAAFQHANTVTFPNIRKMLVGAMVLLVTSCEAERSFSTLWRLKTHLQPTMTQERLSGLALMNLHPHTPNYAFTRRSQIGIPSKAVSKILCVSGDPTNPILAKLFLGVWSQYP